MTNSQNIQLHLGIDEITKLYYVDIQIDLVENIIHD